MVRLPGRPGLRASQEICPKTAGHSDSEAMLLTLTDCLSERMGRGQTEVPIPLLHFSEEEKESGSEKERSWLLLGEQGQANMAT